MQQCTKLSYAGIIKNFVTIIMTRILYDATEFNVIFYVSSA